MTTLNVGNIDRALRALIGIALAIAAAVGVLGWWAYIVAVIAIGTAAFAFCPLYRLLGIGTTSR